MSLRIDKDVWVVLDYVLYDDEGEVIESTDGAAGSAGDAPTDDASVTEGRPIGFVFGHGALVPGLERGLVGMAAGETRVIEVEPDDAYGPRDEGLEQWFDRDEFPKDVAPEDELPATDDHGRELLLRVVEVKDDGVLVDTNHPLAGERLTFDVIVRAVRPATKDEIATAKKSAPRPHLPVAPSPELDDEQ